MNCFNHRQTVAIGICKSCGKALCPECIEEIPNGLACKSTCVERAGLINQIIDNNKQVLSAANVQGKSTSVFLIVMGLLFCAFGIVPYWVSKNPATLFFAIMGLLFLISGIHRLQKKARFPEVK